MAALGVQIGISRSQVSRICADIDIQVQAFLNRPLQESGYAYVFLDATYLHGRLSLSQQVCYRAAMIAMGSMPTAAVNCSAYSLATAKTKASGRPSLAHS